MRRHRTVTPEEQAESVALRAADEAAGLRGDFSNWWETFHVTYASALREFQLAKLAKTG